MNTFIHVKTARFLCSLTMLAALLPSASYAQGNSYRQRNLVSDGTVAAENTDPNLVNGWGVAFNPFGFVWVADNGTGVATLYDGTGKPQSLVVRIPSPANSSDTAHPTGIVFSGSANFVVAQGATSGPSRFIFATEDGVIAGWAPNVDMNNAIRVVDNSTKTGAVYKGLALSANGTDEQIYAADFHNNRIDVFDSSFKPVTLAAGAFSDPSLPSGFAPFGIHAIQGDIYVTYAMQDEMKHDDVRGPGAGYVNVFDPDGKLIRRVASQGDLNSPWGVTLAPAGFGEFSGRLLIGNFGDGLINAYDVATGESVGQLKSADGQPIRIDGLWGLAFGNGIQNQQVNTLFFAAGPNDEQHGLYGRIDTVQDSSDVNRSSSLR